MFNSISSVSSEVSRATQSSATLNADFDTFLQLLTTQLANQDPLNPTDTAEFTNQLVLFSQAEQQIRTNSQLETLLAYTKESIGAQSLDFIGKDVTYGGSVVYFDGNQVVDQYLYSLPEGASKLTIEIKDSRGDNVISYEYGAGSEMTASGIHEFNWDGRDANGNKVDIGDYGIYIEAYDGESTPVNVSKVIKTQVQGVESTADGSYYLILTGNRSLNINDVNSVQSHTDRPALADIDTTTEQQES